MDSGWTVNTLLELMNERDKRYEQHFRLSEEAVRLAKEAADAASGKISIAWLLSIASLVVSLVGILTR